MNRIRHLRKAQGMTQGALAAQLGTSTATVSRLESADIRLSADWLGKIAEALGTGAADLLDEGGDRQVNWLGEAGPDGWIEAARAPDFAGLIDGINLPDPVSAGIGADQGPFRDGDLLFAARLPRDDMHLLVNRVCLAALCDGRIRLGRLLWPREAGRPALVPLKDGLPVLPAAELSWTARPLLSLRRL